MKLSQQMQALGVAPAFNRAGTSLFYELPDVLNGNVRRHFGSSFASQRRDDYSDAHVFTIAHNKDWVVTLYMSFGEWRFGAFDSYRELPLFLEQLKKLQAVLETQEPVGHR